MGTGVVIDPRGYILTNFHVVDGVRRINVTLDTGQSYVARIVARDTETDLAVIQIRTPTPLSVVKLGTSQDLMPGETVIAVGNAFGYENTVTTGIISALHRNVQVNETQQYLDLIQTDASINPGNSGGPLLNIDGEMIGVNVAVRAGAQGIGFAIPIDKALDVATRLMSIEELEDHWHGMTALSVDGPTGPVTVARVQQDSPAKEGGIERGDLLERIGSISIRRPIDVERALLGHSTGDRVPVVVRRNNETVELSLKVADRPGARQLSLEEPSDPLQRATWESLGMILEAIPRSGVRQANTASQGGLRIVAVRPGSSAAEQGVRKDDILVRMHRWKTDSVQDLRYIVDRADALARAGQVKFYIVRGTDTFFGHLEVASTASSARR
jgi:serine protease Do